MKPIHLFFTLSLLSITGPVLAHKVRTATPTPTASPTATFTVTATPTITSTGTATPTPTATQNPCSFPYGVTQLGQGQPSAGWVYESPLDLSHPATVDEIHAYASEPETLLAGLYNGSDDLLKAVTFLAPGAGWQTADFSATLQAGRYYLAEYGTGPEVNLAPGAGVSCSFDKASGLPKSFHRSGNLAPGLPVYLTGCRPQTIRGLVFGLGGSIIAGQMMSGDGKKFMDLFSEWLNRNYGPVTVTVDGVQGINSTDLSGSVSTKLSGVTVSVCVLEIGMKNLESAGGPDSANCGGASLVSGLSAALLFGSDLQNILSVIRSHLTPGGILLVTNLYECDDYSNILHPDWKDYPQLLRSYNRMMALVAKANGAQLIDLYSLMAANPSFRDSLNMHPNSAGHAAIAALLEKAVEEAPLPPEKK